MRVARNDRPLNLDLLDFDLVRRVSTKNSITFLCLRGEFYFYFTSSEFYFLVETPFGDATCSCRSLYLLLPSSLTATMVLSCRSLLQSLKRKMQKCMCISISVRK